MPRDPVNYSLEFDVGSELIVEWRALTVRHPVFSTVPTPDSSCSSPQICLVDVCAEGVRKAFGLSEEQLPLPKVLEGGTWRAGRLLAFEKRPDGSSPIRIRSDGTVF